MKTTTSKRAWFLGAATLVALGAAILSTSRGARAGDANVPPPDGKYENVSVEGRIVPMIEVRDHGASVLIDDDGKKPRTWEEQLKRKGNLPNGSYNVHKTNIHGAPAFDNEPIDREGLWVIDARGNITGH